jgi:hypothetical protein
VAESLQPPLLLLLFAVVGFSSVSPTLPSFDVWSFGPVWGWDANGGSVIVIPVHPKLPIPPSAPVCFFCFQPGVSSFSDGNLYVVIFLLSILINDRAIISFSKKNMQAHETS